MKKILGIVSIAIVLLVVLVWPYLIIFSKSCQLNELGMSMQLPGNGFLLTRNIDRGGLPVDIYKLIKGVDVNSEFQKNDIYLTANYESFEIQIDAFQDFGTALLSDLDKLTDNDMQEVLQSFAEQYKGDKVSIATINGYKYIVVEYSDKKIGDSYTTKAYMTIKNGRLISIALLCPDKQINNVRNDKLQQIVNSIKYSK